MIRAGVGGSSRRAVSARSGARAFAEWPAESGERSRAPTPIAAPNGRSGGARSAESDPASRALQPRSMLRPRPGPAPRAAPMPCARREP
ncbi:hypothetical protein J1605_001723 [Eschrichtius robustus]|uniref:Uncharacterized protein n=1 Tax=Eschrichtius robustus TaxID=9764 RepID=A0AB34HZV5_ESCRO|nr:hypothetical protein J1605_001723 [Eschrichtius robustus]